jgi:hypothetical protein
LARWRSGKSCSYHVRHKEEGKKRRGKKRRGKKRRC